MGSTHLKAMKNLPGVELAAVASDDPVALTGDLSGVQGNIGGPGEKLDFSKVRTYSDWKDAVADPAVEAVDVCLPTHLHAPAAIGALRSGKHVLVEKPMALDAADVDRMIAEAAKARRVLMTAQVLRFWSSYRPLVERVKTGQLGPVRSALFRRRCAAPAWGKWMAERGQSGGGVFDLLIHDVDMCLHLFGAPEAVSATGYEDMPRGIDVITAELWYRNIGPVIVTGGWHHPKAYPFSMEYTVVAEGGTVEFSSAGRPATLYGADGEAREVEPPAGDAYRAEIEYFLECAAGGRRPVLCPPEESAAAVKLAKLMVEAREKKGEKIACQL